jgi:hypothetical protein
VSIQEFRREEGREGGKCWKHFLIANLGPEICHEQQYFTALSKVISLCKLHLLPPSVTPGVTALKQNEELCNSAVVNENRLMSVTGMCC